MDVIDSNEIKQYFIDALKDTSFFEIKKEGSRVRLQSDVH